jgi:Holliday junction resolvasome RuvABC endonuclease subunit
MTSPALCRFIGTPGEFSFEGCEFLFLTGKKFQQKEHLNGSMIGRPFKAYRTDTERFLLNAHDIKHWVKPSSLVDIYIEGYSFGSRGSRLFQIGEAVGILKTLLMHDQDGRMINEGRNICPLAPSAIKKFATGKGNADKQMMYNAFFKETGCNLLNTFKQLSVASPINDIVDAYYICKLGTTLKGNTYTGTTTKQPG